MLVLVSATHAEARPLIEFYRLKRDVGYAAQQLFRSEQCLLIESGLGKIRAAVAITRILERAGRLENVIAVNFGVCGSRKHAKGDLLLINKIYDTAADKNYYPDLLGSHNLTEAGLETRDRPCLGEEASGLSLDAVDMEAAGFFQAASLFLAPSRISVLKVVSDDCTEASFSPGEVPALVETNLPELVAYLAELLKGPSPSPILESPAGALIEALRDRLKLTARETQMLIQSAKGYQVRNGAVEGKLREMLERNVFTREDRKSVFAALLDNLNKRI